MKFYPYKQMLAESLAAAVDVAPNRDALAARLNVRPEQIRLSYCAFDDRIGQDRYMVDVDGRVAGFTDGPFVDPALTDILHKIPLGRFDGRSGYEFIHFQDAFGKPCFLQGAKHSGTVRFVNTLSPGEVAADIPVHSLPEVIRALTNWSKRKTFLDE